MSFHEIPSDQELREKWLKVISRDNWTPNSTSIVIPLFVADTSTRPTIKKGARREDETICCDECFALVTKPNSSAPSDALIRHQDRGGLLYPSAELVMVLHSLKKYVEVFLAKSRKMNQPLKAAVDNAAEVLQKREQLECSTQGQHEKLVNLVLVKFFRPLFVNFATSVTDRHVDIAKVLHAKPLCRKVLKL